MIGPEIQGAIIALLGAILLAVCGGVLTVAYFSGQLVQKVNDLEKTQQQHSTDISKLKEQMS